MRPKRSKRVPRQDQERYEAWRGRLMAKPAPVDPPDGRRVADMPPLWQEHLVASLIRSRATWAGPDDWCHAYLEERK